jgi:TatD DNase family protein
VEPGTPVLFDTHAHLTHADFAGDLPEVLARARAAGVRYILNAGWDLASSAEAVALADPARGRYAAVGIHPHEAARAPADWRERLEELAGRPGVVALGEIGLDYHYDFSPRPLQQRLFAAQLALAGELELPVLVHDREAHADTLAVLRREADRRGGGRVRGVMHCYSGSRERAPELLGLGLWLGLGGPLTFANARRAVEVASAAPLAALLLETDCPYLAPGPYRGRRNEPAYLVRVAEALAAARGLTVAEVAEATTANAWRMLGGMTHLAE